MKSPLPRVRAVGRLFVERVKAAWAAMRMSAQQLAAARLPRSSHTRRRSEDMDWIDEYAKCSILYAPMHRIAEDSAIVPWHLWRLGDPGPDGKPEKVEVLRHPFLDIWNLPNPHHPGESFRYLCILYLKLRGRLPLLWFAGPDGKPASIWPINPADVLEFPIISDPPQPGDRPYWKIRWFGRNVRVKPNQLIYISRPDPRDPYGPGMGDVESLGHPVKISRHMDEWSDSTFRNGARVGNVVGVPGLNADNRDAFEQDWQQNHSGTENAGRDLFVGLRDGSPAVSVVALGKDHRELDFIQGVDQNEDRVLHVLSTPPEIVGKTKNSNRATSDAADRIHAKNNIKPILYFFARAIAVYVLPLWGEKDLVMEPEECVHETGEQRHKEAQEGWDSGWLTRDEIRIAHGKVPLGGDVGKQLKFPINQAMMDADGGPIITAYPVKPVTATSSEGTEELVVHQDGTVPPAKALPIIDLDVYRECARALALNGHAKGGQLS